MAIAMVGTPIALSLGVPLGTWLGGFMGWRMAFGLMSGMTLVLIAWVLIKVPDYPGQSSSERMALRQVFFTPGVRSVLGVVFTWMLAHNILYTYVAPFVSGAGLANDVDVVLLAFGIAALLGIWVTGRLSIIICERRYWPASRHSLRCRFSLACFRALHWPFMSESSSGV